nr:DUF3784 domain-containing protein [uncultured Sellimonas sp.]
MISYLLAIGFMTIASISLINGKALIFVPGYRNLSDKEKAALDTKKVGRKMGIPMLVIDFIMIGLFIITYLSGSETLKTYGSYGMLLLVIASFAIVDVIKITDKDRRK